ncbi:MAG: membrane associated rhomboid family serine protease [Saprospiraceae bacterium]|jgi:membrane associated rhomboid family serine protease
MASSGAVGTLIMIVTGLTTYKGLRDYGYFEDYKFNVDKILPGKEYKRIITSGFLHGSWLHYGFNMIALLSFSLSLELVFGYWKFLLLYFGSMIGGSFLALFIHKNHGDYSAIGASGAISGVVMSSILLFPDSNIGFIILPFEIKSWVFALLFILISVFGIKSQRDNIGHEAHLGGALTGVLISLLLQPSIIFESPWIVFLTTVPIIVFLILIVRNPAVLMIDKYWGEALSKRNFKQNRPSVKSDLKVVSKAEKEETINHLLDKIKKGGVDSLSKREKELLDRLKNEL